MSTPIIFTPCQSMKMRIAGSICIMKSSSSNQNFFVSPIIAPVAPSIDTGSAIQSFVEYQVIRKKEKQSMNPMRAAWCFVQ